jgi:hypothetical protein
LKALRGPPLSTLHNPNAGSLTTPPRRELIKIEVVEGMIAAHNRPARETP